jgi:ubiquinone/menaquinone biosynthesis C-methylase UbiE
MFMKPFRRGAEAHALAVGMSGVKLGEQFAQIGCGNGARLAAIAKRVGLSGRAIAIVGDEAAAARVRKGAAHAGVLVEVEIAPSTRLPVGDGMVDLVIIDDTIGTFASAPPADRHETAREAWRILRPGGRVLVISASMRSGILARLTGTSAGAPLDAMPILGAGGFRSTRVLAEREGLVFVEGIKPRA